MTYDTDRRLYERISELERGLTWFLNLHGHRPDEGCEYCDKYRTLLGWADARSGEPRG
jgi:hypothetical protein